MRRRLLAWVVVLAALPLAGCGVGAGDSVGGVSLIVTRDFGRADLKGSPTEAEAPGGETAMRALQRSFDVKTRYGGGFVQSIDGLAGGTAGGRPVDWFYYVNGIEAPRGAASTELHRGDVVWWDRHDWGAASRVPAIVGAFPEPFDHGIGGERLPTRLECSDSSQDACGIVAQELAKVGVIAGQAALETRGGEQLLRVVVGPWPEVRRDFTLGLIAKGPGASGVFAKPSDDGRQIAVMDPRGRVVRTLGAGTGLIAASATGSDPPVWVVTGTDAAGIAMAARALTTDALRGKFAVALQDDVPIALPQVGPAP
ncbi:MAG: hypothetical protein JWM73_2211 [Solirubrobacterales bacterium]|nr:hypothetical protein [Solirubrobacterales bacterium]